MSNAEATADKEVPASEKKPESSITSKEEEKLGFVETVKTFPRSFWMGCGIEMWERLAYYGVRSVVPLYIAQADDPGGLHFSQAQKGSIFAAWALVQSLVPMVSGGFADRYGYKKTIATSVTLAILGYVLMGTMRSYPTFFAACLILALGTALFKPGIQGMLAQSTSKRNSSVGWGLFYWLVNVGAAGAPLFGGFMRTMSWSYVFFGSAAVMSLNYLMLFTYREVESGADKRAGAVKVLVNTVKNLADLRLVAVIALFSGFWMMLYQLWDLMPNFFADWTESSSFVASAGFLLPAKWIEKGARGMQLKQEYALNLNAALIVLFVIPVSFVVARIRVMTCITCGVLIATIGTLVYGTSPSIYMLFGGIALFSLGEMLTGPKKTEYFSLIAPPGKKALYLGYVNIPIAIGQALGAKLAGWQYGANGEKAVLALKYLAEKTDSHGPGAWNGDVATLESFVGVTRKAAVPKLIEVLGQDANAVNRLLWETYHPYQVWYWFAAVGLASLVGLVVFARVSQRWKDMDV